MKKSFLLYCDSLDVLEKLTDEQCGKLLRKFRSYHTGISYQPNDEIIDIIFVQFKNQFDRDFLKYDNICIRNKENIKKRYSTKSTSGKIGIPKSTKSTDNDNDNDNDTPKEYKNKEYKEITYTQEFEMFWKSYPKKKGKQKAMSIRKKIKESEYDMVIEGAKRYSDECKKKGTDPKYIKRPEGWLKDRRREDIDEDIEPSIENKNHYEWYKRNINGTEFTDIDGTKKIYQDINYRRFLIYDRGVDRAKAQELYEKARGEFIDLIL